MTQDSLTVDTGIEEGEQPKFAIVELMGHRRFGARVHEVTRYGIQMCEATILRPSGDIVMSVAPASIYAITECSEEQARAANRRWDAYVSDEFVESPKPRALPPPSDHEEIVEYAVLEVEEEEDDEEDEDIDAQIPF